MPLVVVNVEPDHVETERKLRVAGQDGGLRGRVAAAGLLSVTDENQSAKGVVFRQLATRDLQRIGNRRGPPHIELADQPRQFSLAAGVEFTQGAEDLDIAA